MGSKRLGPQSTSPLSSPLPEGNITLSTTDDNIGATIWAANQVHTNNTNDLWTPMLAIQYYIWVNVANFYSVKDSKILRPLLAIMVILVVVINLIINQSYKLTVSNFLWDWFGELSIFLPSSRVVPIYCELDSSVCRHLAWGLEGCRFKSYSDQKRMMWTCSWRMLVHIVDNAEVPLRKALTPTRCLLSAVACVAASSLISYPLIIKVINHWWLIIHS